MIYCSQCLTRSKTANCKQAGTEAANIPTGRKARDTMNAYRQQQLRAAELIESGATAEQVAEVFGWTERAEPERIETGDKRTLTPRRKCGIIKSIRRYIIRRKRTEEVHTMTIYGRSITNKDMRDIADYMDDALREELHSQLAPCSNDEFLREYINRDPDIMDILRNEFDFRL